MVDICRFPYASYSAFSIWLGVMPERLRFIAIDIDGHLRAGDLKIGGDVLKSRKIAKRVLDNRRPVLQLLEIRAAERVLIQALAQLRADANGGRHLQIDADARHLRELGAQFLDDVVRA